MGTWQKKSQEESESGSYSKPSAKEMLAKSCAWKLNSGGKRAF